MYTNKIGCTVFARTVGKDRMEQYVRHFFPAVYWEDMKGQSQSGTSMKQQDSVLCIIPAASVSGYIPKRSDPDLLRQMHRRRTHRRNAGRSWK